MYIIACNYHAGNKSNSNGEKREHEQDGIGWPDRIPKTQPAWDAAQRDRAPTITSCKYHLFFLGGRNANPMTPPKHILDNRVMTQHNSCRDACMCQKNHQQLNSPAAWAAAAAAAASWVASHPPVSSTSYASAILFWNLNAWIHHQRNAASVWWGRVAFE